MKKIILFFLLITPFAIFAKHKMDYSITYKLDYKEAKETLLQLVLIDSLTKDTLTAPIEIAYENQQDSSSKGKMITYDFENINAPQPFIPALYTFKNNGCTVKDVDIKKNKLNCLTIFLTRGSIEFSYSISDTTPVDFEAKIMFQKYDPQHAIIQDCKKIGYYKLGTYYVEVNTFPISKKHVNVELGKRYTLIIEKPGNLIIDKPSTISALKMYENKFRAWRENKEINLNEKANYTLKIQPGEYKFTWLEDNQLKEAIIIVQSDKTERIYFNN
jgi:hypothetical protein